MTRARNLAGLGTVTSSPTPIHIGPIGVLTATRIDGEFNQVDLATRNITAAGIAATNLQVSGITTGLNVSGIITAQNGINFNGTSTGLNLSGVTTVADLSATTVSIAGTLTYEDVTNVDSVGVITARGLNIFGNTTGLNVASGISTFQAVTGTTATFTGGILLDDSISHIGDTDTKIRFSAANTVSMEVNGSEGFKVDTTGTTLTSTTDASLFINTTNSSGSHIRLQTNGTNKTFFGQAEGIAGSLGGANDFALRSAEDIVLSTNNNNTPNVILDTSGRVLIGTTTEGAADADNLTIADSGSCGITLRSGTSAAGGLYFSDATSGAAESDGAVLYNHSSKFMAFYANESERARITQTGDVNIGGELSQTDSRVHIQDVTRPLQEGTLTLSSQSTTDGAANNGATLRFYGHDGTTGRYQASIRGAKENGTSGNYAAYMAFNTRPAGGSMTERMRITSGGQFLVGNSSVITADSKLESTSSAAYNIIAKSTNGNGGYHNFSGQASNGTITSYISHNGRGYFEDGVQFDSSGEVLDIYEEGTWTPVPIITYNPGGRSITAASGNEGIYVRIGRFVHVEYKVGWTALSGSGAYNIGTSGLPFAADATIYVVSGTARSNQTGYTYVAEGLNANQINVFRRYDNGGPNENDVMYGFATYQTT